jgi:uncharacterized protein (TIGR04255 family)
MELSDFPKGQPVLGKPPLKAVICQMRFPLMLEFNDSRVRPLQQALADRYPITELNHLASFNVGPSGPMPDDEGGTIYRFRDESLHWTVAVTSTSLSLETDAYHDFPTFARRWHGVAVSAIDALGLAQQERIGLRYVNEVECQLKLDDTGRLTVEPRELEARLRPELVGAVGRHEHTQRLMSSMQEMRFAQKHGYCTIRHGLACQPDHRSAYILDLDVYDEALCTIELGAQINLLAHFNHVIYALFEWAISDERFAMFEPKEVAGESSGPDK